jgi:hypothetical protein
MIDRLITIHDLWCTCRHPGLVIAMEEQHSRQHVVDLLNRLRHTELAEEASRVLPDAVDADWLAEWLLQHGLTHDDFISQMGGSP